LSSAKAQTINKDYILPGNGLKQHPFLYVGEWDIRNPTAQSMFLVRDGKIVWQYSIPQRTATGHIQEFDDATLLSNGILSMLYVRCRNNYAGKKSDLAVYLP